MEERGRSNSEISPEISPVSSASAPPALPPRLPFDRFYSSVNNAAEEYLLENTNNKGKAKGVTSATHLRIDLEEFANGNGDDDLRGLIILITNYLASAKVRDNRASSCKDDSLVVAVMLALNEEFELEVADIKFKASGLGGKKFRQAFCQSLLTSVNTAESEQYGAGNPQRFFAGNDEEAAVEIAPSLEQQIVARLIDAVKGAADQYSEDNKKHPKNKAGGLASTAQISSDLEEMRNGSLRSIRSYVTNYIKAAQVEEYKASGNRKGSLVVKVMQAVHDSFPFMAEESNTQSIQKQAKTEVSREAFRTELERVIGEILDGNISLSDSIEAGAGRRGPNAS